MTSSTSADLGTVSRDELADVLRKEDIVLIDVLSPESYAASHIDGAINLPVAELQARAPQVIPDKNRPIVVYCGGPT
jgi:rhodanese-related sulfurtransferase